MSDFNPRLPARPSFEQLRKQATERLRDLRTTDANAKLADAQFALAREYGFPAWAALKHYLERPEPSLAEQYEMLAHDLVDACNNDAAALTRLHHVYGRDFMQSSAPFSAELLRRKIGSTPTLAEARWLVARQHGVGTFPELTSGAVPQPFYRIHWKSDTITPGPVLSPKAWDAIFDVMKERRITGLDAGGRMTDAALKKLAKLDHVTRVNLDGSLQITDAGLGHLVRMPQLRELNLGGWKGQITDEGLKVLGCLPELRKLEICWQQCVSDIGLAHLSKCESLEEVNLLGTQSGDGAVNSLAGKSQLRQMNTGRLLTDVGIRLLHDIPCFKTWQGGEIRYGLMGAGTWPTRVMIDGGFQDLSGLVGLDGLFGLGFFWHSSQFRSSELAHLAELPRLGFLSCGESRCDDEAMRSIGRLPQLRMLVAQGAVAGDAGFAGLGKSQTLEYLWGRDFRGLTSKGFRALSKMPALRGLAVNCANLSDRALSLLPHFPALRELTPMNVSDDGFKQVGKCVNLEAVWCMYCRDTGDLATQQIAGLSLKSYYAGGSRITDRSLEILGKMATLERVELWQCLGVTDQGVAHLAKLPRLRELTLSGLTGVTLAGTKSFRGDVDVVLTA